MYTLLCKIQHSLSRSTFILFHIYPLITPSSVIITVVITSSRSLVYSSTLTHFLLDNSFPGYFPFVLELLTWYFYTSHSHFQIVFSLDLLSHLLFCNCWSLQHFRPPWSNKYMISHIDFYLHLISSLHITYMTTWLSMSEHFTSIFKARPIELNVVSNFQRISENRKLEISLSSCSASFSSSLDDKRSGILSSSQILPPLFTLILPTSSSLAASQKSSYKFHFSLIWYLNHH